MPLPLRLSALLPLVCWGTVTALAAVEALQPLPPAPQVGVTVPTDPLATLRPGHPRLLARTADFDRLRAVAARTPALAARLATLATEAQRLAAKPVVTYDIPDGKRLLATSQAVKHLVLALGLQYRLTGDRALVERIWADLDAARKFPDWNPKHFLDTAEMTAAFGIAYDWLYDAWSDERRTAIRQAIRTMGLAPGEDVYARADREGVKDAKVGGWARLNHNWNQVCNGGLLLGALAIADEEPAVARSIVREALTSLPYALVEYGPDGAWGEGPGYWSFATEFTVYALAALDSALGQDFGLGAIPGISLTGDFPPAFTGPSGMPFNYADATMAPYGGTASLYWLATRYQRPDWAAAQQPFATAKPKPLDALWGAAWATDATPAARAKNLQYFRHHQIVTMRTAVDDPRTWWVGFKGGDNQVNHGHLDLGSFVLDAAGVRWAYDLGADNYNLPGYFGSPLRWTYYRNRAEAHNTLLLNPGQGPDQDPQATAPITATGTQANGSTFAVADLTQAYRPHARRVQRRLELGPARLTVQDELDLPTSTDLWWMFHTAATVTLQGATADLAFRGETLRARIVSPAGATFQTLPLGPLPSSPQPEGQLKKPMGGAPKEPIQTLAIHLPSASGDLRLTVEFTPATP